MCTCTQSSGYSQSASLPAHNQITAPQFIRRNLHSSWYKQIPTHCLLLFTIEAGDLLDLVKNTMKDTKKIEKIMLFLLQMPAWQWSGWPTCLLISYEVVIRLWAGSETDYEYPLDGPYIEKKRRFRAPESCYFAVFLLCLSWFWRGQETNNT